MRAAVLDPGGTVAVVERPRPSPAETDVVVDVSAVGICGSDLHYYEHGRIGDYVVDAPIVLGHESAGVVAAVGDDVTDLSVGDRVALEPGVPCRACEYCRSGRYNLCPDVEFMATPPHDGAFAEAVAWPADYAYRLPDSVDERSGALAEPVSVALHACRRGDVGAGDDVLVTGGGPIGLLCAAVADALGAGEVVLSEPVEAKRSLARDRGVTAAVDPTWPDDTENGSGAGSNAVSTTSSEERSEYRSAARSDDPPEDRSDDSPDELPRDGVDVAIEATGDPDALEDCLAAVRRGGTVVCVGLGPDAELPLDVVDLVDRELTLRGSFRFANTYPAAIDLLADGAVDADGLVDFEAGLDDIGDAFECAAAPDLVKGMIRPQQ